MVSATRLIREKVCPRGSPYVALEVRASGDLGGYIDGLVDSRGIDMDCVGGKVDTLPLPPPPR